MPLNATLVGSELGTVAFDATPRRVLAYAAALGVSDERNFDDARPDFSAIPQFCVCAEWPLASSVEMRQRLGLTVEEAKRAIHLGQDSTFHARIRGGSRLRVTGRLVEARSTRAGAFTVSRLDIVDDASGDPLVTTWSTGVFLGVALDGEAHASEGRPDAGSGPVEGPAAQAIEVPIAREAPHVYTECSGIWNPIHTERRAALALGLPDIILHGTATWAIAGRELVRACAIGDTGRLSRLAGEFRAPVIPGTRVTIHYAAAGGGDIVHFKVRNHLGEEAISNGLAIFSPAQVPTSGS